MRLTASDHDSESGPGIEYQVKPQVRGALFDVDQSFTLTRRCAPTLLFDLNQKCA
jgi:hypothetical protein